MHPFVRHLLVRPFRLVAAGALFITSVAAGSSGCGCGPTPAPEGSGLIVTSDAVRACDVVLRSSVDEVPRIEFTEHVVGEFVPRAPFVAVSFAAVGDDSIANVELGRAVFAGDGALTVERSECFDRPGTPITDAFQLAE